MKNMGIFIYAAIVLLSSCGAVDNEKLSGAKLSEEVCDCKMKTKGMKYDDPERKKLWDQCLDLQGENFKKIATDKTELEIFKKNNADCMKKYTVGG